MANNPAPEDMSYDELIQFGARLDRLIERKKMEAQTELRKKVVELVKAQGMSLEDIPLGGVDGVKAKAWCQSNTATPATPRIPGRAAAERPDGWSLQ